jgi:hypothetical protein
MLWILADSSKSVIFISSINVIYGCQLFKV